MKPEDAQVLATLAVAPLSVIGAAVVWNFATPVVAFAVPVVCFVAAAITALDIKPARNFVWMVLAAQCVLMAILYAS